MIRNLENSPKVPFELDAFILHSEKPVELVHLLLKPGEKLEKHKNPFDVIFFVIEGEGMLALENEQYSLKKNDVLKVTSDQSRSWDNSSVKDLRLLVIKHI